MKVLASGDRNWKDKELIRGVLADIADGATEDVVLIHGAARGADTLAGEVAAELGWTVQEFPANWNEYGRSAGPIRNRQMLKEDPDILVAFHDNIEFSKGTKDMVTIAEKKGVPTTVYVHDK